MDKKQQSGVGGRNSRNDEAEEAGVGKRETEKKHRNSHPKQKTKAK
jgi:hypothetical protein